MTNPKLTEAVFVNLGVAGLLSKHLDICYLVLFVSLILFASCFASLGVVKASPATIYSNPQDGEVLSDGSANAVTNAMSAGDSNTNVYYQAFVKFSLSGISGTVSSATLYLYLEASSRDGTSSSTSPLQPPNGLGDCVVRHINDYGTLDPTDLNVLSIGNDPGVLLSSSATPNVGYVSIDVKAAMQDDINNGRAFSSFMIKMTTNTDSDNSWDYWFFLTSESGTSTAPYIDYTLGATVIPEYPLGLPLLAIFMIFAYGLIKRRTRNPESI